MKYNKFPDNYFFQSQIVFDDRFLFFLPKIVDKDRYAVLFDPFEEKFFGHTCKYQILPNQILEVDDQPTTVICTRGYHCDFSLYVGLNAETPLLFQINRLRVNETLDMTDLFFNPFDGKFINIKNIKYLGDFAKKFPFYYESNLFAFLGRNNAFYYENWENVIDVRIRQQYNTFKLFHSSSKDLVIIQPKISSEPKVLKLDFVAENVYKHPTEPLLIVYNNEQYAIIDLDI